MKRSIIGLLVVVLIGIVWFFVMEHINTRKTYVDVQMSGTLDRVRFFKVGQADLPLVTLEGNGNAMSKVVELPNSARKLFGMQAQPAQYYFVATEGGQSYQSAVICCETGFSDKKETLIIRGLNDWEVSS